MNFEFLETERLRLRKMTDGMYEDIVLHSSDQEVIRLFGIKEEDLEKERAKAEKGFSMFNKSMLIFHLVDRSSDTVIGWCGYHTWFREHRRAEIGYMLFSEEFYGKGLMSEAVKEVIRYGFETMKLNRIDALVGPENHASLKIVDKFGFKQEGVLRHHYFTKERFEDSVYFGLLAEEYQG